LSAIIDRDVVDVGVVLALDQAGGRDDLDVEAATGLEPATSALTPLPPVMQMVSPST
jgi:hypothetical protein